jgi:hypothetical protein
MDRTPDLAANVECYPRAFEPKQDQVVSSEPRKANNHEKCREHSCLTKVPWHAPSQRTVQLLLDVRDGHLLQLWTAESAFSVQLTL